MATTRLGNIPIGKEPYAGFVAKTPAAVKGEGPFTRLTQIGIGGERATFTAKDPAGGKGEGLFTRLTQIGIGGRRLAFTAKTAAAKRTNTGGWDQEEDRKFRELVYNPYAEPEISPISEHIEALTVETTLEPIADDIALILAIAEATEKNTYYTV